MEKVTFIEHTDSITGEVSEHAIIDRGNGEFTSMLKSTYDEQQASLRLVTPPDTIQTTQPDEADLTEGTN